MIGGEAARLFVTVDAQVAGAVKGLNQVDTAVHKMAGRASPTITPKVNTKPAEGALTSLKSKIAGIGTAVGGGAGGAGIVGGLMGGLTFTAATMGIGAVVGAVTQLGSAMIGGASQMEKYTTQLGVLLGGTAAAEKRMAELAEFAKTTPFELPEVVEASKQLQVFTKGVLATGEGLRLVGDIASGTGMAFGEAAMWIGRLYDALQSGRPIGEAAMRLQEVGAMSGESRVKLEQLAEQVKKGAKTGTAAWAEAAGEFGRYSGMMQKQSETLEGKMSNLADSFNQMMTKAGTVALPAIKSGVDVLITALDVLQKALGPAATAWDEFWERAKPPAWLSNKDPFKFGWFDQPGQASLTYEGYDEAENALKERNRINAEWDAILLKQKQEAAAALERAAAAAARRESMAYAQALAASKPQITTASQVMLSGLSETIRAEGLKAADLARMLPAQMGEALRSGRTAWMDSVSSLQDVLKNSMTKAQEVAMILGVLTSKAIATGLKSGDKTTRAQTAATVGQLIERLVTLQGGAWVAAYDFGAGIPSAMAAAVLANKYKAINATVTLAEETAAILARSTKNVATAVTPAASSALPQWVKDFLKGLNNTAAAVSSGSASLSKAIETDLERANRIAAEKLAKIKSQFDNFKSFLSIWPRMTAEAITASLDKTIAQLSKIWTSLSALDKMAAIDQAGQEIIRREEQAKAPPEVQAVYAEIDTFAAQLTAIMKRLNDPKTSEASRKILLARAAAISAEIERHKREAEELMRLFEEAQAAVQANIDAAAEAAAGNAPSYDGGDSGGYDYYSSGSGSPTTNYNIDMDVDFNGPTLDPYGDFATRLAAALIPGLQRELARQGINL